MGHLSGKEPRPADVLTEGKRKVGLRKEEGSYNNSYDHMTEIKNNSHEYFILTLSTMKVSFSQSIEGLHGTSKFTLP